ncbi:DUF4139 domain-containing protein [Phenylobacterium montanum]|uniref:DUF4139 domain-containing protein n=1 Tax=Phenylobacterium montanum TaxID=2823693 RepID=A0A975G017_9CAUL|nr:DUF4139 domain-containing protein [Caulobacter sp. S6]QUD87476.1 DUF4139 domain-containing protein [Caulobacter sp. S6]
MGGRLTQLIFAVALALPVLARADTISAAPEKVEVVVYRDRPARGADLAREDPDSAHGLALVTETRTVDLPAGRTRLSFEGVADGIIPESAAVEGLPGSLAERNFDYDLLSPGSLIAHLTDQPVHIVRTDRKTGRETSEAATVRAGPDGVVLQTAAGVEALRCSGGPEKLVFDSLPKGLASRPTLSVVTDTPAAGRYQVRVSYLSVRIDWAADYVARISPDGKSLDLTGWITLANHSAASFADAPTAVVAGRLARVPADLPTAAPQHLKTGCWPMGTSHHGVPRPEIPAPPPPPPMALMAPMPAPPGMREEVVVTAQKRTVQTDLGDYKLYSLVEPTTVAAHQVKQVQFLHQAKVGFDPVYRYDVEIGDNGEAPPPDQTIPTRLVLRLKNKAADGLGEALPAGLVSFRQAEPGAPGHELFLGQAGMRDVPVNEPFELNLAQSPEVVVRQEIVSAKQLGWGTDHRRLRAEIAVSLFNHRADAVITEVRQPQAEGLTIVAESLSHDIRDGAPAWRIALAARSETTLTYTVEFDN